MTGSGSDIDRGLPAPPEQHHEREPLQRESHRHHQGTSHTAGENSCHQPSCGFSVQAATTNGCNRSLHRTGWYPKARGGVSYGPWPNGTKEAPHPSDLWQQRAVQGSRYSTWLCCFDQEAGGMGDEGSAACDLPIEGGESIPVPVDAEIGHGPDDES